MASLRQCETFEVTAPELNIARSGVFNYFHAQRTPEQCQLFAWEGEGWTMAPNRPDMSFVNKVAVRDLPCSFHDIPWPPTTSHDPPLPPTASHDLPLSPMTFHGLSPRWPPSTTGPPTSSRR